MMILFPQSPENLSLSDALKLIRPRNLCTILNDSCEIPLCQTAYEESFFYQIRRKLNCRKFNSCLPLLSSLQDSLQKLENLETAYHKAGWDLEFCPAIRINFSELLNLKNIQSLKRVLKKLVHELPDYEATQELFEKAQNQAMSKWLNKLKKDFIENHQNPWYLVLERIDFDPEITIEPLQLNPASTLNIFVSENGKYLVLPLDCSIAGNYTQRLIKILSLTPANTKVHHFQASQLAYSTLHS